MDVFKLNSHQTIIDIVLYISYVLNIVTNTAIA
jgi:hypothetical protein